MAVAFGVDHPGLNDLAINQRQILMTPLRFMESLIYLLSKCPRLDSKPKVMLNNMNQQYQIPQSGIILKYQGASISSD
jgi:hypothetical protein